MTLDPLKHMKRPLRKWTVVVVCLLAAGLVVFAFVRRLSRDDSVLDKEAPIPVATMAVLATNVEKVISATGDVEPWREVEVSPQVTEKILELFVDEGDVVTGGQTIAILDSEQAQASYDAAIAERESAKADTALAVANYENAESTFRRVKNLYEKKIIGEQEYDDSQTALKLAKSKKDVADAQLSRLKACEQEWAVKIRQHHVRAPFAGTIAARHVDPGALVSPRESLVRLVRTKPAIVKVELPESQAEAVARGAPARIHIWVSDGKTLTGVVDCVYPVLDARWRTRCVEIRCANENGMLRPGMFTRVGIIAGRNNVLIVPDASVLRLPGSGLNYLFVVRSNTAVRVDVEIEQDLGAWKAIRGAVTTKDKVIVKGQTLVQSGTPVTASETEMLQ